MISVIIVNYFSANLTGKAVRSVLQENEDLEVLIVDNSTSREERDKLEKLPEAGKLRLLFNPNNAGFAKACNQAFALSKGDYLLLLNPDAYVLPGALKKLKDFLIENPRAGAAGPRIYWDDDRLFLLPPSLFPSPARELYAQLGRLSQKIALLDSILCRRGSLKVWKACSPVKQKALSGGHVMLRRSAVETSGGLFDDRFFMYYEDSDLMHRLRKNGYSLFVIPEAEVIHRYTHNLDKTELMLESRNIYFDKNFKNNFYLAAAGKLSRIKKNTASVDSVDIGDIDGTQKALSIGIPVSYRKEWLFEWSPSPSFIPSVGCFGKGPKMEFPKEAWELLGPGSYFGRLSKPACITSSFIKWHWKINK